MTTGFCRDSLAACSTPHAPNWTMGRRRRDKEGGGPWRDKGEERRGIHSKVLRTLYTTDLQYRYFASYDNTAVLFDIDKPCITRAQIVFRSWQIAGRRSVGCRSFCVRSPVLPDYSSSVWPITHSTKTFRASTCYTAKHRQWRPKRQPSRDVR